MLITNGVELLCPWNRVKLTLQLQWNLKYDAIQTWVCQSVRIKLPHF